MLHFDSIEVNYTLPSQLLTNAIHGRDSVNIQRRIPIAFTFIIVNVKSNQHTHQSLPGAMVIQMLIIVCGLKNDKTSAKRADSIVFGTFALTFDIYILILTNIMKVNCIQLDAMFELLNLATMD